VPINHVQHLGLGFLKHFKKGINFRYALLTIANNIILCPLCTMLIRFHQCIIKMKHVKKTGTSCASHLEGCHSSVLFGKWISYLWIVFVRTTKMLISVGSHRIASNKLAILRLLIGCDVMFGTRWSVYSRWKEKNWDEIYFGFFDIVNWKKKWTQLPCVFYDQAIFSH
jgi:hypothetical protein